MNRASPRDALSIDAALMRPFLHLYRNKELKARQLVLEHGRRVFEIPEYRQIVDRLQSGYSLEFLQSKVAPFRQSIDHEKFLSLFLDRAIDRGAVVPLDCVRGGRVYRAYRHGEDVEFGEEEERLCIIMLKALATASGSPALAHTWVEKALVLLIRIGLQQQFFNAWEGQLGDLQSMGIRYSLHGAVVATSSVKLYHTTDTFGLTDLLEQHRYLRRDASDEPWRVATVPQGGTHAERANKAALVGSTLGTLLSRVSESRGDKLTSDDLILLGTCLYPKDVAGALAAMIDATARDWHYQKARYAYRGLTPAKAKELGNALRRTRCFFASHNGAMKLREFMAGTPWKIIRRVCDSLTDPIHRGAWLSFWPIEAEQRTTAIPEALQALIHREGVCLYRAMALFAMLEVALRYQGASATSEPNKKAQDNLLRALADAKTATAQIGLHTQKPLPIVAATARLEEGVRRRDLKVPELHAYALAELDHCLAERAGVLAEVDALAGAFGRADKLSYYRHTLHIDVVSHASSRGRYWKLCDQVFHECRGQARGASQRPNPTILAEVPSSQCHTLHGRWICASGPMARTWLVRLALRFLAASDSACSMRCTLMAHLPENGLLLRSGMSTDYTGPLFWQRAKHILDNVLGYCERTEFVCVVDADEGDINEVMAEVRREDRQAVTSAATTQEITIDTPLPGTLSIARHGVRSKARAPTGKGQDMTVDVGVLTILPDEWIGVKAMLKDAPEFAERDGTLSARDFYEATMSAADGGRHRVACTRAMVTGQESIMSAYQHLAAEYSPTVVALVGIGGSIHPDAGLCDVVIADEIFYYDKRAETERGTNHRLLPYCMEPWIRRLVNRLFDQYGDKPVFGAAPQSHRDQFKLLLGPIGTGGAVIKHRDAEERRWLLEVNDKTLALDTEAAGVAHQFTEDKLVHGYKAKGYLVIRGISDHADVAKDDKWRASAATNAMIALGEMLKLIPAGLHLQVPRDIAGG